MWECKFAGIKIQTIHICSAVTKLPHEYGVQFFFLSFSLSSNFFFKYNEGYSLPKRKKSFSYKDKKTMVIRLRSFHYPNCRAYFLSFCSTLPTHYMILILFQPFDLEVGAHEPPLGVPTSDSTNIRLFQRSRISMGLAGGNLLFVRITI